MFAKLGLLLVVLVCALGGGAYYNYERNAHLDRDLENRKYATLTDAQVVQLLEAYRGELDALQGRAATRGTGSEEMRGLRPADLKGRHDGFDRFQRKNRAWREARGLVFERQAAVEDLEREVAIREAGVDTELGRILRRVSTF